MEQSLYNHSNEFVSGQYIEYDHCMCPIYFDIHIEQKTGVYWITGYISYADFPPIKQHIFNQENIYTSIDTITNQMQKYAIKKLYNENPHISQHQYIQILRYIQQLRNQINQKNIIQYIKDIYHYYQNIHTKKESNKSVQLEQTIFQK